MPIEFSYVNKSNLSVKYNNYQKLHILVLNFNLLIIIFLKFPLKVTLCRLTANLFNYFRWFLPKNKF